MTRVRPTGALRSPPPSGGRAGGLKDPGPARLGGAVIGAPGGPFPSHLRFCQTPCPLSPAVAKTKEYNS